MEKNMYDMVIICNVSGNNTNPTVCVRRKDLMRIESFYIRAFGVCITADTSDFKYLTSTTSGVQVDAEKMEKDIAEHIIFGTPVEDAVTYVMDELYVETRILADRAGLSKIDYTSEHNF